MLKKKWTIPQSEDLYHIQGWGQPYFGINRRGRVVVFPHGHPKKSIDLKTLVEQLVERGISTPFLLRFNDILTHRLKEISEAFATARETFGYAGGYTTIYPIKVNQQRHVVEQITRFAKHNSFGLEAGSKPELLAVMALSGRQDMPIVCNGYKDHEFFEIALMGTKLGKRVFPVIEKFSELETMIKIAKELNIQPNFGVRVKLFSSGSGKWQKSGGHLSKFGLTISELLRAIHLLKRRKMLDGFSLLHFHLGSQITDIKSIKSALKEAGHIYVELKKMGIPLTTIDVGGGLGVDYDGSRTKADNSINYTVQEYANDVVFQIQEICDHSGVPHPRIFTEAGRAVAAHHAILVFNILGMTGYNRLKQHLSQNGRASSPLRELFAISKELSGENVMEYYHDAVTSYQECLNLFSLGYLGLKERALAEEIYFQILIRCRDLMQDTENYPEELEKLKLELSDTFFCNFSVFQSLPDYWAVDQRFPIMPLCRLNEEPTRLAQLADITCDSDGKVDSFIDPELGYSPLVRLHTHKPGDDYYIGVFLVGAYQETLGDLHNLFGDTNAVHVRLDKNNKPVIETVVKGDTVKEVLSYVQYDVDDLVDAIHDQLEAAVQQKKISFKESGEFLKFYENALEGYTYLEDVEAKEEF